MYTISPACAESDSVTSNIAWVSVPALLCAISAPVAAANTFRPLGESAPPWRRNRSVATFDGRVKARETAPPTWLPQPTEKK